MSKVTKKYKMVLELTNEQANTLNIIYEHTKMLPKKVILAFLDSEIKEYADKLNKTN